jgi:hypothetical protein
MRIAIISKTAFLKEVLEQSLNFTFELLEENPSNELTHDLIIFDEIPLSITSINTIYISHETNSDLQTPLRLSALISLINEKLKHKVYHIQKLEFSPSKRCLSFNNSNISLTEKESSLIFYLIKQNPRKVPKIEVLKELWNYSLDTETTTLEVHLSRLKQKLTEHNLPELINYKDKMLSINM